MTTGKTIALTRQTLADKVMSLLFNMLSIKFSLCQNQFTDKVGWIRRFTATLFGEAKHTYKQGNGKPWYIPKMEYFIVTKII